MVQKIVTPGPLILYCQTGASEGKQACLCMYHCNISCINIVYAAVGITEQLSRRDSFEELGMIMTVYEPPKATKEYATTVDAFNIQIHVTILHIPYLFE